MSSVLGVRDVGGGDQSSRWGLNRGRERGLGSVEEGEKDGRMDGNMICAALGMFRTCVWYHTYTQYTRTPHYPPLPYAIHYSNPIYGASLVYLVQKYRSTNIVATPAVLSTRTNC